MLLRTGERNASERVWMWLIRYQREQEVEKLLILFRITVSWGIRQQTPSNNKKDS